MGSIFSFQKKLILLGLGSLGGIFGLNYAFKGDADQLVPELSYNQDELSLVNQIKEADVEETPEDIAKKEELRKAKEAQRREIAAREWQKVEDEVKNDIRTGALRKLLFSELKRDYPDIESLRGATRRAIDFYLNSITRKRYPFIKDNDKGELDWTKIKEKIEELKALNND